MAFLAFFFALAFTNVVSGFLIPRASIDSDKVIGFNTTVPEGVTGDIYQAYQPHLYVMNGCVPFPAVDAAGNTNAGLKPTGPPSGDCKISTGQIYVRGARARSKYALMYSWYMPKDSPSTELGHRHDWEGVIVWLPDSTSISAENILAVCPSAHGGWDCSTDGFTLSGTSPLIKYFSVWPLDHQLGLTSTKGGMQPLVAWESLPDAARRAIEKTDFGSATPPFKDSVFEGNLADATFGS
ncbi:NPP1 domain protein [Aspergillus sclerotialis]|uniref:NPP1 domain protein n=1 Tax=Aspergillus sclerotialis TaxID=2070753 RepID=A0A3A2ZAV8_9EURO|nr:NPP1 domain protein [Aspergillus sclerotialis]